MPIQEKIGDIPTGLQPYHADFLRKLRDVVQSMAVDFNALTASLSESVSVGEYRFSNTIPDDGSFTLPAVDTAGYGILVVGEDDERANFTIMADGTVNLIIVSDNVVANADTDGSICIGTSVAVRCVVKNRLGSTKKILLRLFYN